MDEKKKNNERIVIQDIREEFEDSFLRYSMAVITDRAIPDVRDGLKTIHRRLLWTMVDQMKLSNDKQYKKSAMVCGNVLAVHPHGDAAIYDAAARIALKHVMRYPLIDGQGNFGSISGDGAASSRYTEMRPTTISELSVLGVNKNAVDMKLNYSEEILEPVVLPGLFPNLLCNPTMGIAVGVASNFASHNLTEVVNGIIAYIKNKDITVKELMEYIKGPDFPLGGTITNQKDLLHAYETGKSSPTIRIRGDYSVKGNKIIFTSLPFGVPCSKIKEQVSKYISDFENYIENFTDQTNEENGVKIVFELLSDKYLEEALQVIFKKTSLEDTFSINQTCLVNNAPKVLSLKEIVQYYVSHQIDVICRMAKFDLEKTEAKAHILNGLIIALEDIDNVIKLIKTSANKSKARESLILNYKIDELQANAILDMKLSKISNLEVQTVRNELEDLNKTIKNLKDLLNSNNLQEDLLIKKITDLKERFGDARRTKLENIEIKKKERIKEIIPDTPVIVSITKTGIAKIVKTETNSKTIKYIKCKLNDTIVVFDNLGNAYKLPVVKINQNDGIISKIIDLKQGCKLINFILLNEENNIIIITKNGFIKCTSMKDYSSNRTVASIKLKDNDEIIYADLKTKEIVLVTNDGLTLSYSIEDMPSTGRVGIGLKAILLKDAQNILNAFSEKDDIIINNIKIDSKKVHKGKRNTSAK